MTQTMKTRVLVVAMMVMVVIGTFVSSAFGAERNTKTETCTVMYSQTMDEPTHKDYKVVIETEDGNVFEYYTISYREAHATTIKVKFDTKGTPTREDDRVIGHKATKED